MGGLLVFALFGLYLWLSYLLARRINPIWLKALTVVVLVLIPTADAVYGRVKLKQMCEAEGGLKIIRSVEGIEGLFGGNSLPEDEWITKEGYKFIEGRSFKGKNVRKERGETGALVTLSDINIKSKFGLGSTNGNRATTFTRTELFIYEIATQDKLATFTNITFRGGWVERLIAGLYSGFPNSGGCEMKDFGSISWVKLVLRNDRVTK